MNGSTNGTSGGAGLPTSPSSVDLSETAALPLVIREKDVEYQVKIVLLIKGINSACANFPK